MTRVASIARCAMLDGKWRRTIGKGSYSAGERSRKRRRGCECSEAFVRRIALGDAPRGRRTLSPQASFPFAHARGETHAWAIAGVGAESLLLPVDHSDQGRDYPVAGD